MMKTFKTLAIAGATAAAMMMSPAAFAGDITKTAFSVERTSNPAMRVAVKAFKKGEFERSVRLNQQALRSGLSSSRASVAHSNLCASYAMLGNMDKAAQACETAIDLKSDNETAIANAKALNVKLAQLSPTVVN